MSDTSEPIRFETWVDPVVEAVGFPARGVYAEFALTSVLGPTAMVAMRAVVAMLEAAKIPVSVDLSDFARSIGVGAGTGNNAVIRKALQRLEHFGLARPVEGGYAVRTWVAPLTERQLSRASQRVRLVHSRMTAQRFRHQAS